MNQIENVIFDIAEALRGPVLILALVALAVTLIELGAFAFELLRRRRRDFNRLETAAVDARDALARGDETGAKSALRPVAWSTGMARALAFMIDQTGKSQLGDHLAKGLADFDFRSLRRLERTRLLVRAGPALGLMGTLIPLSPALEGLANGNTEKLSENLRVAFSVTVLGLLIGAIAFAISLVRDRLYGQDLSDLEFVAATLAPESDLGAGAQPLPIRRAALVAATPAPPSAAAPPPPSAAVPVGDKPPPPKDAKPLDAALPPPTGAPGAPAAPAAPAAPPVPDAASAPTPAAPPVPDAAPAPTPAASVPGDGHGAGAPPPPMPTGGQSTAASPPAAGAPAPVPDPPTLSAPPVPEPPSPAAPPAPAPVPEPPAPVPGDPPTEQLAPSSPADRPTQASNPQADRDGHGAPAPAPENQ
jgi:biopolymer transport protein ExbB/TolQ